MNERGIDGDLGDLGYRNIASVSRDVVERAFAQGGACSICGDENTLYMCSKRKAGIVVSSKFFCETCFGAVIRAARSIKGPVLFRAGPFG